MWYSCPLPVQQLLIFTNVLACLHSYSCHYFWHQPTFSPPSVRPNKHQRDAFSSGMSLNQFLMDRVIFLMIYLLIFSEKISALPKALLGLLPVRWGCVHMPAPLTHACGVFVSDTVSSCSSGRLALLCLLWCQYFCLCPWDRCQKPCAGREQFHGDYTQSNAKQIAKSLQHAGLHLSL